jgi:hypothetical protein
MRHSLLRLAAIGSPGAAVGGGGVMCPGAVLTGGFLHRFQPGSVLAVLQDEVPDITADPLEFAPDLRNIAGQITIGGPIRKVR